MRLAGFFLLSAFVMFLVSARVCCAVRRAAFPASSNLSGAAWRCFRTSSAALIKTPPEGWSADTLPNPSKHGDWVSTQPSSYVCNPDGVLTHGCEQTLNALLSELEHGVTVPCSGVDRPYQVAVVAVQHMRDGSDGATAEAFAKGVHDIWGVGYPPAQTGAVVFIALQDKQLYISTGVAVSQVLPDTFLKFLIGACVSACVPFCLSVSLSLCLSVFVILSFFPSVILSFRPSVVLSLCCLSPLRLALTLSPCTCPRACRCPSFCIPTFTALSAASS